MEELEHRAVRSVPFYYHGCVPPRSPSTSRSGCAAITRSEEAMNWMIDIARESILRSHHGARQRRPGAELRARLLPPRATRHGVDGPTGAPWRRSKQRRRSWAWRLITPRHEEGRAKIIREDDNKEPRDGRYRFEDGRRQLCEVRREASCGAGHGRLLNDKEMLAAYCPMVLPLVGYRQGEIDYNTSFNLTGIYGGDGQKDGPQ